jgi:hypothetical protein
MNKQITWLLLGLFLASLIAGCAPAATPTTQVVNETAPAVSTVPAISTLPAISTVPAVSTVVVPAPTSATAPAIAVGPVTLTLYNPTGSFEVTQTFAPRLADLNGKTICEVSDNSWQYDRTFPLIASLLQKQLPTVKIITYDKFPNGNPGADVDALAPAIQKAGCQAAIVGNAG